MASRYWFRVSRVNDEMASPALSNGGPLWK